MLSRIKPALVPGRTIVSSTILGLAGMGLASLAAIAADTSSVRCPEAALAGAKPAGSEAAAAQSAGGQATVAPQGAAGMKVYVDPETGEFTVPPEDARAGEAAATAFSTSHEGLAATPSPVPGGGIMVDLKGRFRSPLTATVGADGNVKMLHGPCAQASEEGK